MSSVGRKRIRSGAVKRNTTQNRPYNGAKHVKQHKKQQTIQPQIRKRERSLPPVKNLIRLFLRVLRFLRNVCNSNTGFAGKQNKKGSRDGLPFCFLLWYLHIPVQSWIKKRGCFLFVNPIFLAKVGYDADFGSFDQKKRRFFD